MINQTKNVELYLFCIIILLYMQYHTSFFLQFTYCIYTVKKTKLSIVYQRILKWKFARMSLVANISHFKCALASP